MFHTKNAQKVSEITGVPFEIISGLGKIWTILKSGIEIDSTKFAEKCNALTAKFRELVPWGSLNCKSRVNSV